MSEKKRTTANRKVKVSVEAPKALPKIYLTARLSLPTSETFAYKPLPADETPISFRVHFSTALAVINHAVEMFDFRSVAYYDACREALENICDYFDAHKHKDRPVSGLLQFVAEGAPMLELLGSILASRLEALKKETDPRLRPFTPTGSYLRDDETYILAALLACVSFACCHRALLVLEKEVVHPK